MKHLLFTALVAFTSLLGSSLALAQEKPATLTLHVAATGNDQNQGSADKPFATLERARAAIRALKNKEGGSLKQPIVVLVQGGTYNLTSPLLLTPEDSGTASTPITYQAAAGAQPVLSGGRSIAGWQAKPTNGKPLWAAQLPEVKEGKWNFHQLWVNGQRRHRANTTALLEFYLGMQQGSSARLI